MTFPLRSKETNKTVVDGILLENLSPKKLLEKKLDYCLQKKTPPIQTKNGIQDPFKTNLKSFGIHMLNRPNPVRGAAKQSDALYFFKI
jgi:hypothetical protein